MSSSKIEFAVQMTCESCVNAVKKSLEDVPEVNSIDVDLSTGSVVVDTSLPAESVMKKLQSSGRKVALKGYGTLAGVTVLTAGCSNITGVVRFVQQSPNTCIVDGTIDGLNPGLHGISVHECGDISEGCESVGSFFNPSRKVEGRIYGNLGSIEADPSGRAAFKFDDSVIKLSEIIGRSLVISDQTNEKKLACGIIARSAGLFQNPKTICACDGVTIWNEKINPTVL